MVEKLKPCPFCGSEPEIEEMDTKIGKRYFVRCNDDYCELCVETDIFRIPEDAIECWNRRAEVKGDES